MPRTANPRCALQAAWLGILLLCAACAVNAGYAERETASAHAELAKVEHVQRHFNHLKRVADARLWGRKDYWATPSELLRAGGGDCEDLAAAKYFALRELGVPAERLRLVYARVLDTGRNRIEAHVVLIYRTAQDTDWLVLDSLRDPLVRLDQRRDLLPWLSFNETGVARLSAAGVEQRLGGVDLLLPWQQLLARQQEVDPVALVLSIHTL